MAMINKNHKYKDLKKAQIKQKERLFNRIKKMLKDNKAIFLTFSFTDTTLKRTAQKTRLRYIKNFLNEQTSAYILNCDYGTLKEREHYHALAIPKGQLIAYQFYKYGNIKGELIRRNKSLLETAKDLTNHALKDTTKGAKIIYSRTLTANKELKPKIYFAIENQIEINKYKKQERFYQKMAK